MIVWGGFAYIGTGGRYDPTTDTWRSTTTTFAPPGRFLHSLVWTGREMIVWGGTVESGDGFPSAYDPVKDRWKRISRRGERGEPTPRDFHSAVWTGTEMVIWGGRANDGSGEFLLTGGRYDPATRRWTALAPMEVAEERIATAAVWTGAAMVVWGGQKTGGGTLDTGAVYDPAANTWQATSTTLAASERTNHTAVWTGSRMIVWGGSRNLGTTSGGGSYLPPDGDECSIGP
jgi:N-acetylneuraminic acid mutarotase